MSSGSAAQIQFQLTSFSNRAAAASHCTESAACRKFLGEIIYLRRSDISGIGRSKIFEKWRIFCEGWMRNILIRLLQKASRLSIHP